MFGNLILASNIQILGTPIAIKFEAKIFFLASSDFCQLLITFANSLDPDQDQQNVGPDLDSNRLTHLVVLLG